MALIDVPRLAPVASARSKLSNPAYQAFSLLRAGFTVAPILFGLDKFADWLVDWRIYLAPELNDLIPGNAHQAILAGVVIALRPKFGGYLVAAWLGGIIVNLLLQADFYDIALRDFGLLIGALALARLATAFDRQPAAPESPTDSQLR